MSAEAMGLKHSILTALHKRELENALSIAGRWVMQTPIPSLPQEPNSKRGRVSGAVGWQLQLNKSKLCRTNLGFREQGALHIRLLPES